MPGEIGIGSTFAGHRIDAEAGRGGMGVVYRATDLALDRTVALKLIAPALAADPVFRARFESECRMAAAIDHPHVVQILHAGEEDGLLYVTMRYVDGTDLRTLIGEEKRLAPARAVAIVAQVAQALDAAHVRGLVHRDVKPANVLLAAREEGDHAFLTDFGVTKMRATDSGLTQPGWVIGTADYMAPEQARGGEVDARADIYSLGCILFQLLTGALPYDRDSDLEKMWAHVNEPPPSPLQLCPDLPRGLAGVVRRAMAKEPGDRQATAGELAHDALAALADRPAPASAREGDGAPMRVVVADDSLLMRAGVVRVLEDAGFEVVGQAADAEELLSEVRTHRPDVAVTDIRMPPDHSTEGLQAARVIRSELPGTGVLLLSQYVEEGYALELLGESAEGVGYLLKDRVADLRGFADAVRAVGSRGSVLDPAVVSQMLDRRRGHGPLDRLTAREREVLGLMAEGQSNQTIAEGMGLSERALERHVTSIFTKLKLPAGAHGHRRVLAVLTYLRSQGS